MNKTILNFIDRPNGGLLQTVTITNGVVLVPHRHEFVIIEGIACVVYSVSYTYSYAGTTVNILVDLK